MIKRELVVFIVVGSLTFAIDYVVYTFMMTFVHVSVELAKVIGIMTGTTSAYVVNRLWTFKHTHYSIGSIGRFLLLYLATLSINVGINSGVLQLLNGRPIAVFTAFTLAAGIAASLNFTGMRYFVFKTHKNATAV
jgi:putative flippase GtrA